MEGIEKQLEYLKQDKIEKKAMNISTIKYHIDYKGAKYILNISPIGKGYYDVVCMVGLSTLTLKDYFCHSISMSRAKDLILIFHKHLNK